MSTSHELSRSFLDEERYEREKVTRIMPDSFRENEVYHLRIKWPFDGKEFGREFAILIQEVFPNGGLLEIHFAWKPNKEVMLARFPFSLSGFLVTAEDEEGDPFSGDPYFEMGYVVGSTDPWDIALAEITSELVLT